MKQQRNEREVREEAYSDEAKSWTAPVQGYGPGIPWPIHLEAYDAYARKWAPQVALINLPDRGCRGGFSTGELDEFVPGWRDKVSEFDRLKARIAELEAALAAMPSLDAEAKVEWEVWQRDHLGDECWCAGSDSLAEAKHYLAVYSQDGPTWLVEVTRRPLSPSVPR